MDLKDSALSAVEVSPVGLPQQDKMNREYPIAPDQFEGKYRTTRKEIWAYYACVDRGARPRGGGRH